MTDQGNSDAAVQNEAIEKAWENAEIRRNSADVLDDGKGETELYRHFDAWGRLLYVGVSLAGLQRLAQHRENCRWFKLIDTIKIEQWETRELALIAEKQSIQTEEPYFNRTYAVVLKNWTRPNAKKHVKYCGDRRCNGCKPGRTFINVVTGLPAGYRDDPASRAKGILGG